jgi:hypothetical protein
MGQSTDAILAYGYDLGGAEGWNLQGLGEYGEMPALGWYDPENDDAGFEEAAMDTMLASVGFTETDWRADGYRDRKAAAQQRIGVELVSHCSSEYPMYVLAAKSTTAWRGSPKLFDPAELGTVPAEWDDKLRAALAVLGLTPTQERARWVLCSDWG